MPADQSSKWRSIGLTTGFVTIVLSLGSLWFAHLWNFPPIDVIILTLNIVACGCWTSGVKNYNLRWMKLAIYWLAITAFVSVIGLIGNLHHVIYRPQTPLTEVFQHGINVRLWSYWWYGFLAFYVLLIHIYRRCSGDPLWKEKNEIRPNTNYEKPKTEYFGKEI